MALTNTVENAAGQLHHHQEGDRSDFPDLTDPIYDDRADPLHLQLHDPGRGPGHRSDVHPEPGQQLHRHLRRTTRPGRRSRVTEGTPTGLPPNLSMDVRGLDRNRITSVGNQPGDVHHRRRHHGGRWWSPTPTTRTVGTFEVTKEFDGVDPRRPAAGPGGRHDHLDRSGRQPTGTIELTQANDWTGGPTDAAGRPDHVPARHRHRPRGDRRHRRPTEPGLDHRRVDPGRSGRSRTGQVTISSETQAASATVVNGAESVVGHLRAQQGAQRGQRLRADRSRAGRCLVHRQRFLGGAARARRHRRPGTSI